MDEENELEKYEQRWIERAGTVGEAATLARVATAAVQAHNDAGEMLNRLRSAESIAKLSAERYSELKAMEKERDEAHKQVNDVLRENEDLKKALEGARLE